MPDVDRSSALGPLDLLLVSEGRHENLWKALGAHEVPGGVRFAVWAPTARSVHVVGDWNGWERGRNAMDLRGNGVWEAFVPGIAHGELYKFDIEPAEGGQLHKADPLAFATEAPPRSASRVYTSRHTWGDQAWMEARKKTDRRCAPLSIYEMHFGSWRRPASFREIAPQLADYLVDMGFTHVELLPVAEHPYGGSWGYQVSSYFSPTARWGEPDDFRFLVDHLHQRGIGVIVDWVPAHFPKDAYALARFDGSALYEHLDPRQGEHPDWGTLIFNYGRNEVRNFLIANAMYWLEEFHIDGLRVDAVASMLYLDYSRKHGEWVPNEHGGRENLPAIALLRELNTTLHGRYPGAMCIAEESTAWPAVSKPVYTGGLGFTFKWNMGWMHDTLQYMASDPVFRKYHHNLLTFGIMYATSENFVLPLSHDEVVHLKRSLLEKMPGDRWKKFANLRALFAQMWAQPGKKLLFMGGEIAQPGEWQEGGEVEWAVLNDPAHAGVQRLVRDLNRLHRTLPAMHERDTFGDGYEWIDPHGSDSNTVSYVRWAKNKASHVVCAVNFAPIPRHDFRIGVPQAGPYREILNTDAAEYGGSNVGNHGRIHAYEERWGNFPASASITLPPLGAVWFVAEEPTPAAPTATPTGPSS